MDLTTANGITKSLFPHLHQTLESICCCNEFHYLMKILFSMVFFLLINHTKYKFVWIRFVNIYITIWPWLFSLSTKNISIWWFRNNLYIRFNHHILNEILLLHTHLYLLCILTPIFDQLVTHIISLVLEIYYHLIYHLNFLD